MDKVSNTVDSRRKESTLLQLESHPSISEKVKHTVNVSSVFPWLSGKDYNIVNINEGEYKGELPCNG